MTPKPQRATAARQQDLAAAWNVRARIWLYTNYSCNLRCSYCVAESSPEADRPGIDLPTVRRIADEAAVLGFREIFITGGEPLLIKGLLPLIGELLPRFEVTLLTNATLFSGSRLAALRALVDGAYGTRLTLQISLDGATAAANDAYRGAGSWDRALRGIKTALALGARVKLSTTMTPANAHEIPAITQLAMDLGLGPEGHFVRELIRRGFSQEGRMLALQGLMPEVTVTGDGIYWHPVATEPDLLVTPAIFPLIDAVVAVETIFDGLLASAARLPDPFTCG